MKTYKIYFISGALIIVSALSWWFFATSGEFGKPEIKLLQDVRSIGQRSVLELSFTDSGSGLSHATVVLTQDNQPRVLADLRYPGKKTGHHSVSIPIDSAALKLHDGTAVLTITAVDRAVWKNTATSSRLLNVDVVPPQLHLLTPVNHINPGGTAMILFRVSKAVPTAGIRINDQFFPAYPIAINNKACQVAYFALPISASRETRIQLYARDGGGNEVSQTIPYLLLKKSFRHDKMNTSEAFLQQKMPEFITQNPSLAGKPLVDVFIYVNNVLREENFRTIQSICRQSAGRQLWEGVFLRMKDAAPMAQFGDSRTYIHNGRAIGQSVHLGVDLASTANAPIEAANEGLVSYAGYLGIYGNTVIIDHGLGLFSLYGHLANIEVKKGQAVKKGEIIGKSGLTGLAGGDHLHFSLLVGGQFVNPTEWWDPHWIQDNITKKMAVSF